jgi:hypothetical protein
MSGAFTHQFAQVGVGGDFSKGVIYVTAIVLGYFWLVAIASGLLIWGLVTIRRTRGKVLTFVSASILGILAFTAYVVMFPPPPPVQTVAFDFSKSREPPPGHYPGAGGLGWLSYSGRLDVTLRLPNELTFIDRATRITLQRRDAQIDVVTVERSGLTRDEARALESKYSNWSGGFTTSSRREANVEAEELSTSVTLSHLDDAWTIRLQALWPRPRTQPDGKRH